MEDKDIITILSGIVHPETKRDIVSMEMVDDLLFTPDKLSLTLNFPKARDPLLNSIRKAVENALLDVLPAYAGKLSILVKEAAPVKKAPMERRTSTGGVKNIIAVASGKGGVGKSTVAANLAVSLVSQGYKTAVLDADIYGPSMPKMFGAEGYQPVAENVAGQELIVPAQTHGISLMSVGFFIKKDDALIWRGAMATNALRQLIHQTYWGDIDYLLIDLPPGTGDIHLTLVQELAITGAVIVSTPQQVALADVVRGINMFRSEGVNVPVLGLIENMSWFTPAELPDSKYYIFGKEGVKNLAEEENIPLLAQIPLVLSIGQSGDQGTPVAAGDSAAGIAFHSLASEVVKAVENRNRTAPATRKVQVK